MRWIFAQGNSHLNLFVRCSKCGKEQAWIRIYEIKKGVYEAICGKCKKEGLIPIPHKSSRK